MHVEDIAYEADGARMIGQSYRGSGWDMEPGDELEIADLMRTLSLASPPRPLAGPWG